MMVENIAKHTGNKTLNKQSKASDSSLEHLKGVDSIIVNVMEAFIKIWLQTSTACLL